MLDRIVKLAHAARSVSSPSICSPAGHAGSSGLLQWRARRPAGSRFGSCRDVRCPALDPALLGVGPLSRRTLIDGTADVRVAVGHCTQPPTSPSVVGACESRRVQVSPGRAVRWSRRHCSDARTPAKSTDIVGPSERYHRTPPHVPSAIHCTAAQVANWNGWAGRPAPPTAEPKPRRRLASTDLGGCSRPQPPTSTPSAVATYVAFAARGALLVLVNANPASSALANGVDVRSPGQ